MGRAFDVLAAMDEMYRALPPVSSSLSATEHMFQLSIRENAYRQLRDVVSELMDSLSECVGDMKLTEDFYGHHDGAQDAIRRAEKALSMARPDRSISDTTAFHWRR